MNTWEIVNKQLKQIYPERYNMSEKTVIEVVNSDDKGFTTDKAVSVEQAKQAIVDALNSGADTIYITEEHSPETADEAE